MTRIPLIEVTDMTAAQREQYDRFPSNLTRTLLLMGPRLSRALPETANALRASELDPALREAVILRVAALSDSAYERMQHLDQAGKTGWSGEQIAAITAGDRAKSPTASRQCSPSSMRSWPPPRYRTPPSPARAALSDRDLVTVISLIGHYMTVARLTGTLEVDLDAQPDSWTHEH